jgi:hypothetical protein
MNRSPTDAALIERLEAASHDERLSMGWLYLEAADRLSALIRERDAAWNAAIEAAAKVLDERAAEHKKASEAKYSPNAERSHQQGAWLSLTDAATECRALKRPTEPTDE